jgi:uncharacterized protein (TIGR02996 family)
VRHQAFLSDIVEHPEDDTPRLVYADWLEDHGDSARAEFIRGQIQLLSLDRDDPQLPVLAKRTQELEKQHGRRWRRGLPRWAKPAYDFEVGDLVGRPEYLPDSQFHRGFLAVVSCDLDSFSWVEDGEKLFAAAPVEALVANDPTENLDELADTPLLARLRGLSLSEAELGNEGARCLAGSEHLGGLRVLDLSLNDIRPAGIRALARNEGLAGLTFLNLWGNDFGLAGARALAKTRNLTGLQRLDLSHNEIGDSGLTALAQWPLLANVRHLDLGGNRLGNRGVAALADSPHRGVLTDLYLGFNRIDAGGARTLAGPGVVRGLQALDLQENPIHSEGLAALVEAGPRELRWLDLANCRIDHRGVEALAGCRGLSRLERLDLNSNPIGDAGAEALAGSPYLGRLTTLQLGAAGITDAGAEALAKATGLGRLQRLDLFDNGIGPDGGRSLAGADWLEQLEDLSLGGNGLGTQAKRTLKRRLGKRFRG